ncbi:MAG TPA: class I SAM-dependent methyltransferase [Kineosporiaceae bacterium]
MNEAVRPVARAGYRATDAVRTARANRSWWDAAATGYLVEHGDFLGDDRFVWCPEGLDEAEARLLGDVTGADVLEVGCGAAQCSRWLTGRGARAVGVDQSARMLAEAQARGRRPAAPGPVRLVQADARDLPFADRSFDIAFSAYGAVPFVADPERIMAEVARVLRPGGQWTFAITHPIRWAFPDDPGQAGLTAVRPYFDRTPYVEEDERGDVLYAEHHRTLGDRIRDLVGAGLALVDLVEPEWPAGHERSWGGWSPLRGRLLPGTAILVSRRRS